MRKRTCRRDKVKEDGKRENVEEEGRLMGCGYEEKEYQRDER